MADQIRLIRDPDEPGSVLVQINPPQARLPPPTPPHLPSIEDSEGMAAATEDSEE